MNNKWNNNGEVRVYLTPEEWSWIQYALTSLERWTEEDGVREETILRKIRRELNLESV